VPAQSVVLLDTAEEARDFPTGTLTLAVCETCGFLFNAAFDPGLIDYSATTEESQHFSGTFNRFARSLVAEIGALKPLDGGLTLEIGCGKGDFLEELVRETGTRAIGVDPGYLSDRRAARVPEGDIRFRREHFDPACIDEVPDLVVCRHTLEHIHDVLSFMTDVVAVTQGNASADVMFETPDVARVLAEGAFWDIYHEHCSYFTIGSHARLFRRVGLDVTRSYLGFGGQYIIQYARPGSGRPRAEEQDIDEVLRLADAFPSKVAETCAFWSDRIEEARRLGRSVAIWGGGSKCVSFLGTLETGDEIRAVVDINTFKQGKYIPGSAHEVVAPEHLWLDPPDLVIAMNPIYVSEIRTTLADLGLRPEVIAP
jgi:SAM-dependent methyltransferase